MTKRPTSLPDIVCKIPMPPVKPPKDARCGCGNCGWWISPEPDDVFGLCRRYPPTVGVDGRTRRPAVDCNNRCGEHSATRVDPACIGIHPTIEELPLSADCVRIVPGMLVHHPTEGSFMADAWIHDELSNKWFIQRHMIALKSNPVSVAKCYASTDAMLEAARGSS